MKIKISEATPNQLNHLVAGCEGVELTLGQYNRLIVDGRMSAGQSMLAPYKPSTDWAQGGPIIEREQITIGYYAKVRGGLGVCATRAKVFDDKGWCLMYGDTPLIAAMRCFVTSKLGKEVDVPDELNQGENK